MLTQKDLAEIRKIFVEEFTPISKQLDEILEKMDDGKRFEDLIGHLIYQVKDVKKRVEALEEGTEIVEVL